MTRGSRTVGANPHGAGMVATSDGSVREIGEILALGLQRALARKSSQQTGEHGEVLLDFLVAESGYRAGVSHD